jgi:hypothetical protein
MQHEDSMHQTGVEITADLTIPKLFYKQAIEYGKDRVAMREKEFGIWRPITWQDYLDNVKYLALGLISLVPGASASGFFRTASLMRSNISLITPIRNLFSAKARKRSIKLFRSLANAPSWKRSSGMIPRACEIMKKTI